MLRESLEIFKSKLQLEGDSLILDNYIPENGTYVIVDLDEKLDCKPVCFDIELGKNKKEIDTTNSSFKEACFYDYYSKLVDMNKPIDLKKIIHSNNYLSFAVKKDNIISGKLTEGIIDNYYSILANPNEKYKKSSGKEIYENFEKEHGTVNIEKLERNKRWIKEHIFSMEQLEIPIQGKDYLKIFFKDEKENYILEGERYLLPNIYNSNDYNIKINNEIYGLPNNNMGMSSNKVFLANKTRKIELPYLLNKEEVLMQKKFFDYLFNFARKGEYNIFVNREKKEFKGLKNGELPSESLNGFFFRIQKGKNEAEIRYQDQIPYYRTDLLKPFYYRNVLNIEHKNHSKWIEEYKKYTKKTDMQSLINEILFSKCLVNNYFTEAGDITLNNGYLKDNILLARESIFDWLYKGIDTTVVSVLNKVSMGVVKGSLKDGYYEKAEQQFNFRWSLLYYFKGGEDMGVVITDAYDSLNRKINQEKTSAIENDEEYYFAVGQIIRYFLSKNKSKDKKQSLANSFFNAKNDKLLKERLLRLYLKTNYDIPQYTKRFNNLYAMVTNYRPDVDKKINQDMIISGLLHNNLIYLKENSENE